MAREQPTTAYTEVQIDEDSISLTLISESGSNGAVIEDTERFTFDELENMAGAHRTLRLSRESVTALEEAGSQQLGELVENLENEQVENLPQKGDVLIDENSPSWSNGDRVVVEDVVKCRANEYVIQSPYGGKENTVPERVDPLCDKTVADANPSYPDDDRVVLAHYLDDTGGDAYAFPESRVVEE